MSEREIYDDGQWRPYDPNDVDPRTGDPNQGDPNEGSLGGPAPTPPGYVDPRIQEVERRYNGGSPPAQPLNPGHGWEWDGWDWQQVAGRGLGFGAPAQGPPVTGGSGGGAPQGGGGGGGGRVPSLPGGFNVPSAGLPGDILSLFNRQPQQTPVQSAYQDALLKFMGRSQQTPSLDDPILGPQADVFRVQQQRSQERQRRGAVERASAVGQNQSGYLDNLINQGIQQQGFNTAQFNAGLLGTEMGKRREELQAALHLANQTGNAEAQRELQTRLAQASAMMQQQALNLQGQLGSGDLALRLLMANMGNDQFYDSLGVNTALNLEGLNQRALQTILGGLG